VKKDKKIPRKEKKPMPENLKSGRGVRASGLKALHAMEGKQLWSGVAVPWSTNTFVKMTLEVENTRPNSAHLGGGGRIGKEKRL